MTDSSSKAKIGSDASSKKPFDKNKFKSKKTMEKGLLDVAILTTNISSLKKIMKQQGTDSPHPLFPWVIGGLILSICLQVR